MVSKGLEGTAAIIGMVELPAERKPSGPPHFTLEHYALLASAAIADAGIDAGVIQGLVSSGIEESERFVPATLSEYLGIPVNYGERVDLGGATPAGMIWRAAVAVELGLCDAVLAISPGNYGLVPQSRKPKIEKPYYGASSGIFGSPQAEFEIPYGNFGQNAPYAQIARRYAAEFGYDARALAKIAVDQRTNACSTPGAAFIGEPITIDDVLSSPMIADPLHMLEIVMRVNGGAGVIVANADVARRSKNRPVWIKGFGEHVAYKTPTYATDMVRSPISPAASRAFSMSGKTPSDMDVASIYDCYTITVLMSIEDSGFCEKGKAMDFVLDHDLTFRGDFPMNTAGGQLSYGQAGGAGGMHHVCDVTRQIMRRAGGNQIADCNIGYVTGNGGIMSEQVALVLAGD
jgi:acetyl-CoA C-acetyltransferase